MKNILKVKTDENSYCLRKICGIICVLSGILIILTKVIYFMITEIQIPFEGRGQFLVGTGAALLGITSIDNIFINKGKNKE